MWYSSSSSLMSRHLLIGSYSHSQPFSQYKKRKGWPKPFLFESPKEKEKKNRSCCFLKIRRERGALKTQKRKRCEFNFPSLSYSPFSLISFSLMGSPLLSWPMWKKDGEFQTDLLLFLLLFGREPLLASYFSRGRIDQDHYSSLEREGEERVENGVQKYHRY